ncbi:MAG: DUF1338 domain-containing protein [Deltaproteobacteria bacterium]|nr:DUF1338 domain-containing protein [Deltaproteobacteria bacterium]
MSPLQTVLAGLMVRYRANVPDVDAILTALQREGAIHSPSDIENDHIAFRTLGVPNLGLTSLERVFLHLGYQRRDRFHFAAKKLDARWYSPPDPTSPRIFISELRVGDLSARSQALVSSYTGAIQADPVDGLDLDDPRKVIEFLHRPLWRTPTWSDYAALLAESEYAAWAIYNRYYLNHFTIAVHALPPGWDTLEAFNAFLERNGFRLNDSGGKMKVDRDGKLKQSSTVAALVEAPFADGGGGEERQLIAGSYVEFAERLVLDQFARLPRHQLRREHRREGFEVANADRIFESTYTAQTRKRTA